MHMHLNVVLILNNGLYSGATSAGTAVAAATSN